MLGKAEKVEWGMFGDLIIWYTKCGCKLGTLVLYIYIKKRLKKLTEWLTD